MTYMVLYMISSFLKTRKQVFKKKNDIFNQIQLLNNLVSHSICLITFHEITDFCAGSRIGRQPNAVKHAISLEVKRKSLETASNGAASCSSPPNGNSMPSSQAPTLSSSQTNGSLIKEEPVSPECNISFKEVELLEVILLRKQCPHSLKLRAFICHNHISQNVFFLTPFPISNRHVLSFTSV